MAIFSKCHYFFSLLYKQIKPPRKLQSQKILPAHSPPPEIDREMGAAQAMKRIPRIKFPQRRPKPTGAGSTTQSQATPATSEAPSTFFSRSTPSEKTLGGKASLQPKRTPMTQEEIDAILLGGCL